MKKKELTHPHVGRSKFNRVEETHKEKTLGINRQEHMSQPPWAQLTWVKVGGDVGKLKEFL